MSATANEQRDRPGMQAAAECPMARVLAIAGCTNSGKTTMASAFCKMFALEGLRVTLVSQDDYFLEKEKVNKLNSKCGLRIFYDYDSVSAVDTVGLCRRVREASMSADYVLIEGNLLTEIPDLMELVDRVVFLTINQATCRRRREGRSYDPPDESGYFDEVVWPAYQRHLMNALAMAREDSRMTFLDASREEDNSEEEHVFRLIEALSDDVVRITFDTLDIAEATRMVSSPSCGGTSLFVGTTRDTFDGREVVRLEYESYDEMAYKEMRKLCRSIREMFPSVERCVIFHRIGEVAVGEISVIIATASPHRTDAIRATEWAIDELKRTVPIWKKEAYADGGAAWKENADWMPRVAPRPVDNGVLPNHAHGEPAVVNHVVQQAQIIASKRKDEEKSFAEASRARDSNRRDPSAASSSSCDVLQPGSLDLLATTDGTPNARQLVTVVPKRDDGTSLGRRRERDSEARLRSPFWH